MVKTVEMLQEEVAAVTKPLQARVNRYAKEAENLQKLLIDNFLSDKCIHDLLEMPTIDQRPFDFIFFKNSMLAIPTQTEEMVEQELEDEPQFSLASLVSRILETRFFVFENNEFKPASNLFYPPKAEEYVRKFTHVLNLYHLSRSLNEHYLYMLSRPFLDNKPFSRVINQANFFKSAVLTCNEEQLQSLWLRIINTQKHAKLLYKVVDKAEFTEDFQTYSPAIIQLLRSAREKIQQCHREFPDTWNNLVKPIAASLFENQYSFTLFSPFTINDTFIDLPNKELNDFERVMIEENALSDFKHSLLKEALMTLATCKVELRDQAARKGIQLSSEVRNQFSISANPYRFLTEVFRTPRSSTNFAYANPDEVLSNSLVYE